MKKDPKSELQKSARALGERLTQELRQNDPAKEKAFEADQARRDAAASKALAEHLKQRKK